MVYQGTSGLDDAGEFGVPALVIQKTRTEQVRIGLNEFKGVEYIDIRSFYDSTSGFRPTRRGVTIPTRFFGELLKGVLDLGEMLGEIDPGLHPNSSG